MLSYQTVSSSTIHRGLITPSFGPLLRCVFHLHFYDVREQFSVASIPKSRPEGGGDCAGDLGKRFAAAGEDDA